MLVLEDKPVEGLCTVWIGHNARMFQNVENVLAGLASGSVDSGAVGQAATEHVGAMEPGDVQGHLENAAETAEANGQPDVARDLTGIAEQNASNPQALKDAAISYIRNNPQVLTHFAPSFAQGLLSRVNL